MVRINGWGHRLRTNENGLPRLRIVGLAAPISATLGRAGPNGDRRGVRHFCQSQADRSTAILSAPVSVKDGAFDPQPRPKICRSDPDGSTVIRSGRWDRTGRGRSEPRRTRAVAHPQNGRPLALFQDQVVVGQGVELRVGDNLLDRMTEFVRWQL